MKGLEISRRYFEECGLPMLERDFPELLPYLAAGFTGSGSEHYGYDDVVSRDHDFEPGFCLFLPGEELVDRRSAFLLERAYAKLPKSFLGAERQPLSPVGGNRHGVLRTAEFYLAAAGTADGTLSAEQWLTLPDYALAESINGEIFLDNYGEVTRIRDTLQHMPEAILRKRLAGNLLLAAQAGQYNYSRCLRHGEPEAARLALNDFVTACMKCLFLLNGRYMPYYKWSFRALRELPGCEHFAEGLSSLLLDSCADCAAVIETLSAALTAELQRKGLTRSGSPELERQAYAVNDGISDGDIRNLHILAGI